MWFRCLGLICDLIDLGFSGVGLICDLLLWVCFVVFFGFVLWWLWVCWWWLYCVGIGLCLFFLVQLLGFMVVTGGPTVEVVEVVVASGPTVGWVSVAPLEWVLGQWVVVWVFFFFFLGVDGRLWVASGGGGGGIRCM